MSSRSRGYPTPVGEACGLLSSWTGLELRGTAPRRVAEFLRTRAEQLGYASMDEYVDYLSALAPTAEESQQLINLVTNGLTCFWRDKPQLHALETVFGKLSRARGSSETSAPMEPIKVWCAGCSTGEEAYTVAMIAEEHGVPVQVLGSDLNTESLRHARQGTYGEWSLRRTDDAHRQRYFERTGEGRYQISETLRRSVRFEHHNILSPPPTPGGSSSKDGSPGSQQDTKWDVVMCRNVLIYFSDEAMTKVLGHFADSMHQDGYLLLGSSEQLHTGGIPEALVPFRAARQGGGFVYRLRATPPGRTVAFPPRKPEPEPEPEPSLPTIEFNYPGSLEEDTTEITSDVTTQEAAHELLEMAVAHLDAGRKEAALACCEATASYDPFVPENYCLMAYMLAQEGATAQALETYRKVLFLDPFNWIAAVESARLQMRRGDARQAKRLLRQASEGLNSGRRLSRGTREVAEAMERALTDRDAALEFCEQYLERLRGEKFVDS
ncbi:hypothetical protein FIV42_12160 [Persicimonas caeni]|uniref:CheR-type methyltransferase domain-containing protein n=1 Tax=Persicimonas caeni TaxID=2292766 RepID=A0A4Y6PT30_PERCE|nr:CheR family methyltransferase [Persicimonas caeni]QDG51471.1 hypothetical protein FIV42_12160 [Persicimonas caeni]QED32692.1 hypothetical protein FRD00_12155 [Persicimonas caeni]